MGKGSCRGKSRSKREDNGVKIGAADNNEPGLVSKCEMQK